MGGHSKSRKKRKHKHKSIDRSEDKSDSYHAPSKPSKPPSDAYSFIKHEPHMSSFMMPGSETVLHSGGGVVGGASAGSMVGGGGGVVGASGVSAGQILQQQPVYASAGACVLTSKDDSLSLSPSLSPLSRWHTHSGRWTPGVGR